MSAAVASLPLAAQAAASSTAADASAAATPAVHSRALQNALARLPALSAQLSARFAENAAAARRMFLGDYASAPSAAPAAVEERSQSIKLRAKVQFEYRTVADAVHVGGGAQARPSSSGVGVSSTALQRPSRVVKEEATGVLREVSVEDAEDEERTSVAQPKSLEQIVNGITGQAQPRPAGAASAAASTALIAAGGAAAASGSLGAAGSQALVAAGNMSARQLLIASKREIDDVRPEWHAPWKLMRVISAHSGWVRAICVDHSNEWFATGSVDRTIKIFDLASGALKLTLTGHISAIRGLAISKLTPYMFSIAEDKQLKCWDMTQNKVIRDYHAHLSGGYCVSLLENQGGPNILVSGGRDSVGRVWDIRTTSEVAVLTGHTQTVASIACQNALPQVITGSHDTTIKLWDLRKTQAPISTLTNHKKSIRALQIHHTEYTFTSGAGDNLKVWKCPDGQFLRNISGHNATINCLALNRENVLVSGADNGGLWFWDYKSGHSFQQHQTTPQPGSLDAESGIFAMTFDQTGSRLLTAETDKSIKVYKEDPDATEETHPLTWRPGKRRKRF